MPNALILLSAAWITILASACASAVDEPEPTTTTDNSTTTSTTTSGPTDITDFIFMSSGTRCSDYIGTYVASVRDVGQNQDFNGMVTIALSGDVCTFTTSSIPNHDFGQGGAFATPVSAVQKTFEIPANPMQETNTTAITLTYDNAVFLNGVKLDLLAAACYGVGNEPLGQEKIGCMDINLPWRYDPMFSGNSFGTDSNNAHTQPNGEYHYHGNPNAMFDATGMTASQVIGFAADGFPVYGPFIDDNGTIREVQSGYTLRQGDRTNHPLEDEHPPGNWDGTYRDDYEFTDAGDLDECNGMMHNGSYGYYITNSYPWVMACFRGTPDPSFRK